MRLEAKGRKGSKSALDDASYIWVSPETDVCALSARRAILAPVQDSAACPSTFSTSSGTQLVNVIAAFVKRSAEDAESTRPYGFHRAVSCDGNRLRTAIKLANRAVFRKAGSSDDYTGMGTTVAAVIVSRHRPQVTFADQELREGDVILLCSDGLTNMLPDQRILEIISTRGAGLEVVCDELVAQANAQGGRDNISVVLVDTTLSAQRFVSRRGRRCLAPDA